MILAYVAGLSILLLWKMSLVLLLAAILIGWLATNLCLCGKFGSR